MTRSGRRIDRKTSVRLVLLGSALILALVIDRVTGSTGFVDLESLGRL